jgi:hypothetical protein
MLRHDPEHNSFNQSFFLQMSYIAYASRPIFLNASGEALGSSVLTPEDNGALRLRLASQPGFPKEGLVISKENFFDLSESL